MDILYLRTTQKLYNKNAKVLKMECPYLSVAPREKTCRVMLEKGLDGEVDDFDTKHYCKGNPNHCYFYRSFSVQKTASEQLEESKPEKIQVSFFDELSKLELDEDEISVDRDESHPLFLKLIKIGLPYMVKPELVNKLIVRLRRK